MCEEGDASSLLCGVFFAPKFVCGGRDVSSLFCDVVLNVIPIYVCQINDLIFRIIRLG